MKCIIRLARPYLNNQNTPKLFYSKISSTTTQIKSDYIKIERVFTKAVLTPVVIDKIRLY